MESLRTPMISRLLKIKLVLLLFLALTLLGFLSLGHLLSFPADRPQIADAVVVLGGDNDGSGRLGQRYKLGLAMLQASKSQSLVLIAPSDAERKDAEAQVSGVHFWYGLQFDGSWKEALTTRDRMKAMGWRSVLVVSDPPHMLRLRYVWESNFNNTGLKYTLIATEPAWWSHWLWWRNPEAFNFVRDEVLKLGYYIFRYSFGFRLDIFS